MADTGYAYGMGPGSSITITGGPTGMIVEGLKFDSNAGEELEVLNNDALQTVAQSVMSKKKTTVSGTAEFKGWADTDDLIGLEATVVASSSNTTAVTSGSVLVTIKHAANDSSRGNWIFSFDGTVHGA